MTLETLHSNDQHGFHLIYWAIPAQNRYAGAPSQAEIGAAELGGAPHFRTDAFWGRNFTFKIGESLSRTLPRSTQRTYQAQPSSTLVGSALLSHRLLLTMILEWKDYTSLHVSFVEKPAPLKFSMIPPAFPVSKTRRSHIYICTHRTC